ncbi:MAG: SagB/ThcOx family dehydrogenase [Planctomycetota bacterium]
MSEAPSIAERYHDATKYSPEGIAKSQHHLDWEKKPSLWKDYDGQETVGLSAHLGLKGPMLSDALAALPLPALANESLGLAHVARLLFFTNGVTRVVPQPGDMPFLMRAAPSAGGLYPTEAYLVVRDGMIDGVSQGAWNLDVRDLSIARAGEAADPFGAIADATGAGKFLDDARALVVLTGVFWRSAWRYEQRAYRRILLDTGHVLGNLVMSAARLGLVALPIGGFDDSAVEHALGLDAAEEGALVVVPLFDPGDVEVRPPRGTLAARGPIVPADVVPKDEGIMKALHLATRLKAPVVNAVGRDAPGSSYQDRAHQGTVVALPAARVDMKDQVERTVLVRRSTRGFDGKAFTLDELAKLLHFAYQDTATAAEDARFAPGTIDASLLETYICWNHAEGGEPGTYYYRPRTQDLVLLNPGSRSRECHAICLGQELGRDAAAVLFHTADLPRAVARYGDRAYRYLHLDAGHVGQRLNLAAIRLGLGASGIGGFFDDHALQLLGLPPRSVIVYPTCLGRPAEGE